MKLQPRFDQSIFSIPRYEQYNPSITVLRMSFAIFVLFVHSVFWYDFYFNAMDPVLRTLNVYLFKIFQGAGETNPAVIGFITISGYCIHRNGLRVDNMDLSTFFRRRFLRIVPMLLVGTILGAAIFYFLKDDPKILDITYTKQLSWLVGLYKLSGLFVFNPYNFADLVYQGNGPLITCIVEGWLYICYPLLAMLVIKKSEAVLWWLIGSITVAGILACTFFPSLNEWWHNGSLFGFLIYWWIGVYAVDRRKRIFNFKRSLFIGYIVLTLALVLGAKLMFIVELRKILLALIIGAVLQFCETKPWQRLVAKNFFESGYSLYVLHTPLICLALFCHVNFYGMWLILLALAYICYVTIEKPMINLGKSGVGLIVVSSATA